MEIKTLAMVYFSFTVLIAILDILYIYKVMRKEKIAFFAMICKVLLTKIPETFWNQGFSNLSKLED
jgi:hypothetical protein